MGRALEGRRPKEQSESRMGIHGRLELFWGNGNVLSSVESLEKKVVAKVLGRRKGLPII